NLIGWLIAASRSSRPVVPASDEPPMNGLGSDSMSCFAKRSATKPRISSGIRAARSEELTFSPLPSNFAGTIRSRPYGFPPTWSSIHDSSWSSCCGVNAVAPSTPNPPALVTAATTSRQWLKANSAKSIPNCSQMAGFTPPVLLSHIGPREGPSSPAEYRCSSQELEDIADHLAAVEQTLVVVSNPGYHHILLRFGRRIEELLAQRGGHDIVAIPRDHQYRRLHRRNPFDRRVAIDQQLPHRQPRVVQHADVGQRRERRPQHQRRRRSAHGQLDCDCRAQGFAEVRDPARVDVRLPRQPRLRGAGH